MREYSVGLSLTKGVERGGDLVVLIGNNGGRQQRRVHGASAADCHSADGHTRRHLHDRQQRVFTAERVRFDRYAQHRKPRLCRGHAGQMRSAAGASDDDLEASFDRRLGVLEKKIRRSVRGNNLYVVRNTELIERFRRVTHRVPVRPGPHDNADQCVHREILTIRSVRGQRIMNETEDFASNSPFDVIADSVVQVADEFGKFGAGHSDFGFEYR